MEQPCANMKIQLKKVPLGPHKVVDPHHQYGLGGIGEVSSFGYQVYKYSPRRSGYNVSIQQNQCHMNIRYGEHI